MAAVLGGRKFEVLCTSSTFYIKVMQVGVWHLQMLLVLATVSPVVVDIVLVHLVVVLEKYVFAELKSLLNCGPPRGINQGLWGAAPQCLQNTLGPADGQVDRPLLFADS